MLKQSNTINESIKGMHSGSSGLWQNSFEWCFLHIKPSLFFISVIFFENVKRMLSFCGLKHLDRDKQMVPGASTNGQREEAPGTRLRSRRHWIGGLVFLQNERRAQALAALRCRLINAGNIWSMSRCAKSSGEMRRHVSRAFWDRLYASADSPAFIDTFVATRQHTSVHPFVFSLYEPSPLEMEFSGREKGLGGVGGVDVRGVKKWRR